VPGSVPGWHVDARGADHVVHGLQDRLDRADAPDVVAEQAVEGEDVHAVDGNGVLAVVEDLGDLDELAILVLLELHRAGVADLQKSSPASITARP